MDARHLQVLAKQTHGSRPSCCVWSGRISHSSCRLWSSDECCVARRVSLPVAAPVAHVRCACSCRGACGSLGFPVVRVRWCSSIRSVNVRRRYVRARPQLTIMSCTRKACLLTLPCPVAGGTTSLRCARLAESTSWPSTYVSGLQLLPPSCCPAAMCADSFSARPYKRN
jgi:hypothetical protein